MLILDPRLISKSAGLYQLNADKNLSELKAIMKDLLIKEVPVRDRSSVDKQLEVILKEGCIYSNGGS